MIAIAGPAIALVAQPPRLFNESLLNGLAWRNLGPYKAGARTIDVFCRCGLLLPRSIDG